MNSSTLANATSRLPYAYSEADEIPPELRNLGPCWTLWKEVQKTPEGKPAKVPCKEEGGLLPGWTKQTRGLTYEEASQAAFLNLQVSGIGILMYLAPRNLVALDLDGCVKDGETAPWAREIVDSLPGAFWELSPSGKGLHGFALVSSPEGIRFSGKPPVEIYLGGETKKFLTVSAHRVGDGPMATVPAGAIKKINLEHGHKGTSEPAGAPRDCPLALPLPDSFEDAEILSLGESEQLPTETVAFLLDPSSAGDRSEGARKVELDLARRGWDAERITVVMARCPEVWAFAESHREGRGDAVVLKYLWDRACAAVEKVVYQPAEEMFEKVEGTLAPEGHTYEHFYAHMPSGKFIFVPTREMWVASSLNASLPKVGSTSPATVLRRTRPVHQLFWHPGEPEIVVGRVVQEGGWIADSASRAFNRYLPPRPLPGGDAAKAEPWARHVRQLYPGEAEHLFDYFAFKVQHPGRKVNHGLVLGGGQGVGKDTLLDPVRAALGPWNVKDIAPQHLLGEFNPYVECVLLVISEARDMGEMNRFALYEHTKTLLAAPPDVLMMNDKHVKAVQSFNVLGAVFTTNHPTGGLYLPRDDRRHFVAWSEQTKEDFGPDYWNRLYGWYESGGRAHVQEFLAKRDLSLFDPKAAPRQTEAWRAIVNADSSPEDEDLSEILGAMGLPVVTTMEQIIAKAGELGFQEMEARLQAPARIKATAHALARLGYSAVEKPDTKSNRWTVQGRKQTVYGRRDRAYRQHCEAIQALPKLIRTAEG